MSCRVDTTPLLAGACVVSLYPGHGVRGDAVPSTGTHGPSPVYNDLTLPGDAAKEYRWGITVPPASGTLLVYEDCSYAYTPPGSTVDLTVTYTYRLWQDGVDIGTAVETIVIGAGSAGTSYTATMAALTSGSTVTGYAATYTAPGGVGNYTATMAALSSDSTVTGFAASYTAPAADDMTEPVTLSEAKLAARLNADETALDPVVQGYISTARQIAEHETGREYVRKVRRYTFTDWPASDRVMHVYQPSAVAVQWWDGAAWVTMADGTDFAWGEVDQGVGIAPPVGGSWPTLGAIAIGPRVRVDITAGSDTPTIDTPECVKTFIKSCVSFWADNPDQGAAASLQEAPRMFRLLDPERLWGA